MTPLLRLTSTFSSTHSFMLLSSSKPPISKQKLFTKSQKSHLHLTSPINISRRDVALLSFLALVPFLSQPAPATAFSIGISGPKDWLKEQKKKASKFLLAPIDASREILRSAYLSLTTSEVEYTPKELEEFQRLLRSAARDCIPQERNSFVAFQANTGVEVCTFRLIVKNASSLLDKEDPAKLEAEAMLNDLIRSFTSLNGLVNETGIQDTSNRDPPRSRAVKFWRKVISLPLIRMRLFLLMKKVADALMNTISSLNKFEQGVKYCLEV